MRKLFMWNLVTLDGFFEGQKSWDLDWHQYSWGGELEKFSLEQLRAADALLFGRITYEGMAQHWSSSTGEIAELMNGMAKVVFSRSLEKAEWNNTRLIRSSAEDAVAKMKHKPGGNMLIFCSANLSSTLMRAGLIDEYRSEAFEVRLCGTSLTNPHRHESPDE